MFAAWTRNVFLLFIIQSPCAYCSYLCEYLCENLPTVCTITCSDYLALNQVRLYAASLEYEVQSLQNANFELMELNHNLKSAHTNTSHLVADGKARAVAPNIDESLLASCLRQNAALMHLNEVLSIKINQLCFFIICIHICLFMYYLLLTHEIDEK